MRPALTVTTLIGIAALGAVAIVRLGGALQQLRAVDVPISSASSRSTPSSGDAPPTSREWQTSSMPALEPGLVTPAEATRDAQKASVAAAGDSDEHIKQWLAADPEFQRAAADLLNEPDRQVQQEARQLLRELGASSPDDSGR
jgi:hypothetical protein